MVLGAGDKEQERAAEQLEGQTLISTQERVRSVHTPRRETYLSCKRLFKSSLPPEHVAKSLVLETPVAQLRRGWRIRYDLRFRRTSMYRCLALKWHLPSGTSYPAELMALKGSECPWEEILASWRRVGFVGGRISPCSTWHLLSPLQTLTHVWICKACPARKAIKVAQFSIWRDTKRWSNVPARCQRRQWSEWDRWKYRREEHIRLNRPLQPYPNPRCALK